MISGSRTSQKSWREKVACGVVVEEEEEGDVGKKA
jgi:hypothetical protein